MNYDKFVSVLEKEVKFRFDWRKTPCVLFLSKPSNFDQTKFEERLTKEYKLSEEEKNFVASKLLEIEQKGMGLYDVECLLEEMKRNNQLI